MFTIKVFFVDVKFFRQKKIGSRELFRKSIFNVVSGIMRNDTLLFEEG